MLAVRPALPAKNVRELIALAKSRPGHYTYASGGVGGANHLTMELFRIASGIDLVHVPYKGASNAVVDVIGGQVDMLLSSTIALLPHVKAGRLRALGVTSAQRIGAAPDLPTIAESGLPGFESETWTALVGPAGMPREIVRLLNGAVAGIARMPDTVDRLSAQGAVPRVSTPEQARTHIATELAKWAKVIATAGIKAE